MTRAQVGFPVCEPLPPWYPRGWELMLRYPCVTYVYGSPITHPPTILIRQSTRTSECQLPYTGSIAGHICVLAGGGEDAVVVSSLALSEKTGQNDGAREDKSSAVSETVDAGIWKS